MRNALDAAAFDAVLAGLTLVRQVTLSEELTLADGWSLGDPASCNFCNDWQVTNLVGLRHEDPTVLAATKVVASALGLTGGLPPNVNVRDFLFVQRPSGN